MSFLDELNKVTKTPQEAKEKEYKSIRTEAHLDYRYAKEGILLKAENAKYEIIGSKKVIVQCQKIGAGSMIYLKEEEFPVRRSAGIIFRQTFTDMHKRIVIDEKRREEYNVYMDEIKKMAREDGMEAESVVIYNREIYSIPTPDLGIFHCDGAVHCIKYTMRY